MKVRWKDAGDEQRLADLVAATGNAKQRDRYRVVLIAGRGLGDRPELGREQIAATVGRSRQFVDQWVGRYRRGGMEALVPGRQPGAARRLSDGQEAQLRATRAEKEQALADEQAARARRERAEVEERSAQAEREAQERLGTAAQERSAAEELRAKAEKLAPGMTHDGHRGGAQDADVTQQIRREDIRNEGTGGATRA